MENGFLSGLLDGFTATVAPQYFAYQQQQKAAEAAGAYKQAQLEQAAAHADELFDPMIEAEPDLMRKNILRQQKAVLKSKISVYADVAPELLKQSQKEQYEAVQPSETIKNVDYLRQLDPNNYGPARRAQILEANLNRPSTQINLGESKPLTADQADKLVDSEGNPVPFVPTDTTPADAAAHGWGYGKTPTKEEAQQTAGFASARDELDRVKDLVNGGVDLSGFGGAIQKARTEASMTGAALDTVLDAAGVSLSPDQAELLSVTENLSNKLIQAMRGASVGPQEIEQVQRSLPVAGQNKALFKANMQTTLRNIARYEGVARRARGYKTEQPSESKRKVVRSGTDENGNRVYQYEDGSIGYAP